MTTAAKTEIETEPLLKLADVAVWLACSESLVRHLVRTGQLPAYQFGRNGHLRFRRADVEALLTRSAAGGGAAQGAAVEGGRSAGA